MKKSRKILALGILVITLMTIFLLNPAQKAEVHADKILPSAIIEYSSAYNFRQTVNDCGPFNVAAVVGSLKQKEISAQGFAETIEWRLPNGYTLPWGLEKQLNENGLQIKIPSVKTLEDKEKIEYLQQTLSENKPIIILGEMDDYLNSNYEHYITLFGFDREKDEFYAYDPFYPKSTEGMTVDDNGEYPGNRSYSSNELLNFWEGGGMLGLYKWYMIATSN